MADGGGERWSAVIGAPAAPLSEGLRANRHLRARCDCCGRREVFVPDPDLLRQIGVGGLDGLWRRFRCACGARQAFLEVWTGPPPPPPPDGRPPRIWLFW